MQIVSAFKQTEWRDAGLRLSNFAIGDDHGATIPAPRCPALGASHGPSICRALTYPATL
jgi:hypothetical protein